jgi:hypothetical protein
MLAPWPQMILCELSLHHIWAIDRSPQDGKPGVWDVREDAGHPNIDSAPKGTIVASHASRPSGGAWAGLFHRYHSNDVKTVKIAGA